MSSDVSTSLFASLASRNDWIERGRVFHPPPIPLLNPANPSKSSGVPSASSPTSSQPPLPTGFIVVDDDDDAIEESLLSDAFLPQHLRVSEAHKQPSQKKGDKAVLSSSRDRGGLRSSKQVDSVISPQRNHTVVRAYAPNRSSPSSLESKRRIPSALASRKSPTLSTPPRLRTSERCEEHLNAFLSDLSPDERSRYLESRTPSKPRSATSPVPIGTFGCAPVTRSCSPLQSTGCGVSCYLGPDTPKSIRSGSPSARIAGPHDRPGNRLNRVSVIDETIRHAEETPGPGKYQTNDSTFDLHTFNARIAKSAQKRSAVVYKSVLDDEKDCTSSRVSTSTPTSSSSPSVFERLYSSGNKSPIRGSVSSPKRRPGSPRCSGFGVSTSRAFEYMLELEGSRNQDFQFYDIKREFDSPSPSNSPKYSSRKRSIVRQGDIPR